MRDSFPPAQCLKWQKIASYFSTYGMKIRKEKIVPEDIKEDRNGEIVEIVDDHYMRDPNIGTIDDQIQDITNDVINA